MKKLKNKLKPGDVITFNYAESSIYLITKITVSGYYTCQTVYSINNPYAKGTVHEFVAESVMDDARISRIYISINLDSKFIALEL